MSFIRPDFLYGLFAIAIPIIIHLFNFRKHKTIHFSDISLLKTISSTTRKQQKLKHLIVLLLRILAITAIVIALAQPEINTHKNNPATLSNTKAIFVDNSFSMMAEGNNGRLFENARKDAIELITNSPASTNFIIINNNSDDQIQRTINKNIAINELEKLEITSNTKKISQVINNRNRIIKNSKIKKCDTYLLSDFQINSTDILDLPQDTINNYYFLPTTPLQNNNIYIDSCSFSSPSIMKDKVIGLTVWVKNNSNTDYEKIPLKLFINNQQKAVAGINIKAKSTQQITLNFSVNIAGWQKGVVEIEDYPITYDDKLFFSFNVKKHINILAIGEHNSYLSNFYNSDEIFNYTEMSYKSIDYAKINNFDLIILVSLPNISTGLINQLKEYVDDGGNLLFIPKLDENISSSSSFLVHFGSGYISELDTATTRVTKIKLSNNLFTNSIKKIPKNADLPSVNQHFSYVFPVTSGVETLVTLLSGDDFLSVKRIGNGKLYILSTSLNQKISNFASHLLFAPIMYGIAKTAGSQKLYYTLSKDNNLNFNIKNNYLSDKPFHLYSSETKKSIIPGQRFNNGKLNIYINNIKLQSGYYNLMMGDSLLKVIALNNNRSESDLTYYNSEQINELCEKSKLKYFEVLSTTDSNYTEVLNIMQKESSFWKLFIIFALFVIFMEILILRFWK